MAPLPDGSGMIILCTLYGKSKIFPVICPLEDVVSCMNICNGDEDGTKYDEFCAAARGSGARLTRTELSERDGSLYSAIVFDDVMRIASDNPAHAVNIAMASREVPLVISEESFERIIDSTDSFAALKRHLGSGGAERQIIPLPDLTDTHSLRLLCEFVEESMPHGSVFDKGGN
jgi:hypothetical protein